MEKYDYKRVITNEIKDYIMNETDIPEESVTDETFDWLYDEVFDEDSITGNGFSYFDTEEKCAEYLSSNIDLLYEAATQYNPDDHVMSLLAHYEEKDLARYFDCTIRCYLLSDCITMAIDELIKEGKIKWSD